MSIPEILMSLAMTVTSTGTLEKNPYRWDNKQMAQAEQIIMFSLKEGADPYEMLAISWVESRFDPRAVSSTGDYGMMQVNCRVWHRELKYTDQAHCIIAMFDPERNMRASNFILQTYRRYRACRRWNLYACYNGGPGWRVSENRDRIESYRKRVASVKWVLKKRYGNWIDGRIEHAVGGKCIYEEHVRPDEKAGSTP